MTIEEIVDEVYSIHQIKTQHISNDLLTGGHQEYLSDIFRDCAKQYLKQEVSKEVKINVLKYASLEKRFDREMAYVPMRGAIPAMGNVIDGYQVCTHIQCLLPEKESHREGISYNKYFSNKSEAEKCIINQAMSTIRNLLNDINYFKERDFVNSDTITVDICNFCITVELENLKMRFNVFANLFASVYAEVKEVELEN